MGGRAMARTSDDCFGVLGGGHNTGYAHVRDLGPASRDEHVLRLHVAVRHLWGWE